MGRQSKYWMCPVCTKKAEKSVFACTCCLNYGHFPCAGMTYKEVVAMDKGKLKCKQCIMKDQVS